ncbi:MAG TPA: efflux RND transporter periplasmic adaptor subunit [Xanthobacteraceae bacterium]|nr:efflux RND transporter periplasmic adaptor subunit [Xanthobacteraceae bacterium]
MRLRHFVWLALIAALTGCGNKPTGVYQGWIEADLVFVGPHEMGRLENLSVREGDKVAMGAPLFTLDDDLQQADLRESEATLANAQKEFQRAQALVKSNAGTQKALDDAEAALRTAEAKLKSSQTNLARRKVASPANGSVQEVYFRVGEIVPAGRPVISLLPPGNIKVRFFVPETVLPSLSLGETVAVSCDGCAPDLTAQISFIAQTAEYTPPVIYSLEERSKLVFLIEARPEKPEAFRVGQPVTVSLAAKR